MGKGRAPCCDKSKVKSGPWSPAEDLRLTNFIQKHGHPNWRSLPNQAGLLRCGKSCRLRWINYLRPDVKRGNFTPEEEQIIINLHNSFGNKWSKIASYLPGRTDNEIKNVWNTHLKKIVTKKVKKNYYLVSPSSNSTSLTSNKEVEESGIHSLEENNIKSTGTSVEESKETTNYDSPMTSCASNFSNSSQDQNGSSPKKDNEKIEIPFNSDINFWELLDSIDPSQSSITEQDDGNKDFNCYNSSENFDGDFECGKWLRFFENELGLAGTENDYLSEEVNMVQTTMQYEEMYLEPEIGPALDYFPIWHGLL